ncbi:MAG: hypothetical protein MUE33_00390 [Cytophagaceae bacterium]|jgi:ABC-type nitrate/sulfonate/bicarbonate transport system substrate-binding protein|nr:hypothetical protein [Cytophagaceae bacterium]
MIQVGGVPEHFNLPWHIALEEGYFAAQGIDIRWTDVRGGTGAMCQGLEEGTLDMALLLSEGAVAAKHKGGNFFIHSVYVQSPLLWGIHTGKQSTVSEISNQHTNYAISRMGSGSHLMALVDRWQRQLTTPASFQIVQHLDGGLEALTKGESDYFLWEKFTTAPYITKGIIRRVGEVPTPWPCFVLAIANTSSISSTTIDKIVLALHRSIALIHHHADPIDWIAQRYQLQLEDVRQWYATIDWQPGSVFRKETEEEILFYLRQAGIL